MALDIKIFKLLIKFCEIRNFFSDDRMGTIALRSTLSNGSGKTYAATKQVSCQREKRPAKQTRESSITKIRRSWPQTALPNLWHSGEEKPEIHPFFSKGLLSVVEKLPSLQQVLGHHLCSCERHLFSAKLLSVTGFTHSG